MEYTAKKAEPYLKQLRVDINLMEYYSPKGATGIKKKMITELLNSIK